MAALFELNSIVDGVGQVDGKLAYRLDGELVVAYERILYRTGRHPDMAFNQVLIAPYIGDGSPVEQTMWIDDFMVLPSGDGGGPVSPPAGAIPVPLAQSGRARAFQSAASAVTSPE